MANSVTLDEYKVFASIAGDKTNEQIISLLASSTILVEKYMGITLAGTNTEVVLFTTEGRALYFLNTVGTVTYAEYFNRVTGATTELTEFLDYIQGDLEFTLITLPVRDYDTVTLNLSEPMIPDLGSFSSDVKLAVMLLTQHYFKGEYNKTSASSGSQQVDYRESRSLPDSVRTILDFHRIL